MPAPSGRAHQKERTRTAIVEAARSLIRSGTEMTMPRVAQTARVSEATAYRYFPDLFSLVQEANVGLWPDPAEALAPVAASADPVERIGFATEFLLRGVAAYEGAVRAVIAGTVTRPTAAATRPLHRFGLIDHALAPVAAEMAAADAAGWDQLRHGLAVVMSAEAYFTLTDLCGLPPDQAIASAADTARTLVAAALRHVG
ncbi:TetR family transcriptional regulator [Pseudofrankia sp. BMG5.36]|nr:TetR family transcriptional regulator [Pseudofrankia sp. BMG5.36]